MRYSLPYYAASLKEASILDAELARDWCSSRFVSLIPDQDMMEDAVSLSLTPSSLSLFLSLLLLFVFVVVEKLFIVGEYKRQRGGDTCN